MEVAKNKKGRDKKKKRDKGKIGDFPLYLF